MDIGVALFTYCRPEHTQKVLESLEKNNFSKLYIFQDGLKTEKDAEMWIAVSNLLDKYKDKAEIHISQINKGLANSIVDGMNYVFERHEQAIALEDDMVLGTGYDHYMRSCFEKYKDEKEVMCVAGCGWPIQITENYPYDVFFSYRMSSAAWGTWKDRWQMYKRDFSIVKRIMKDKDAASIFEKSGGDLKTIINAQLWGNCDSWAVFWSLLQIEHKGVCVLPVHYLAKDIGHDGNHGTNSTVKTTRYDTELYDLDDGKEIRFPPNIHVEQYHAEQIKMILDISDSEKRNIATKNIYKMWVRYLQNGNSIARDLLEKGINRVYVYGAGEIAELLINELQAELIIDGIIVQDKLEDNKFGIPIYEIRENKIKKDDYVLITPVHDFDYICASLKKHINKNHILNLEELLC